jgi:hypothetical protein
LQNGFHGGVVGYNAGDTPAAWIVSANADVRRSAKNQSCHDSKQTPQIRAGQLSRITTVLSDLSFQLWSRMVKSPRGKKGTGSDIAVKPETQLKPHALWPELVFTSPPGFNCGFALSDQFFRAV